MESASAVPSPEASTALPGARGACRADLGRHRGPAHPLPDGHQGPGRARARLRQRRARVRAGHGAQELRRVPRRARLRRLAARLPRQPRPAVELQPVHGRRHRPARLAGGHRHRAARERRGLRAGDGPLRRRPVALHGHRRRAGGPALGVVLGSGRPSDPNAGQQAARRRAPGDPVQGAGHQGTQHRLRPAVAARQGGRGA